METGESQLIEAPASTKTEKAPEAKTSGVAISEQPKKNKGGHPPFTPEQREKLRLKMLALREAKRRAQGAEGQQQAPADKPEEKKTTTRKPETEANKIIWAQRGRSMGELALLPAEIFGRKEWAASEVLEEGHTFTEREGILKAWELWGVDNQWEFRVGWVGVLIAMGRWVARRRWIIQEWIEKLKTRRLRKNGVITVDAIKAEGSA